MEIIPIDNKINEFKQHLIVNNQVIFSAQFGDGKTFFIKDFKEKSKDTHEFITLYPINYSVAKNEDIFEYIKRDILIQLADAKLLNNIDFSAIAKTVFEWENLKEVISALLSLIPIGGPIFNKILKNAEKFRKNYNLKKETWEKYNDSFINQRGGLYERDGYTLLIEKAIQKIENKKTVLIIEDLDRIDPGHLFRILNILGAHIDQDNEKNKFCFDNIVLVLDYSKTEHLFHHFYGNQANYSGYMSKFISHYPFEYSINQIAREYLYEYIERECGLTISDLDTLYLQYEPRYKFSLILQEKSVRDISKILDNIEGQIRYKTLDIDDDFTIDTNTKIIKLLSIIKRLNPIFDKERFKQSIIKIDGKIVIELLGNFMMVNPLLQSNESFLNYNNKEFTISITNDNNIKRCSFLVSSDNVIFSEEDNKMTEKYIQKACDKAIECVIDL